MTGLVKLKQINGLKSVLENRVLCDISSDLKLYTVLQKDILHLFPISKTQDVLDFQENRISDVIWYKHQNENKHLKCQIILANNGGLINLYEVDLSYNLTIDCLYSWDLEDLIALLPGDKNNCDYTLLNFEGKEIILSVRKQFIITVNLITGQALELKNQFQLTEEYPEASCIRFQNNKVYTLSSSDKVISLYDVESGYKLWSLNISESFGTMFYIATNEAWLIVTNNTNAAFVYETPKASGLISRLKSRPIITAFAKQSTSKLLVQDGKPKKNIVETKILPLPPISYIKEVVLTEEYAFIIAEMSEEAFLYIFSMTGELKFQEKLQGSVHLIITTKMSSPLIICEDCIFIYSSNTSTTEFVNKLMMYSSGKVVESLSQINTWQGVAIELDILELGLRNRQLDTVAFFLKTKCEEFESLWRNFDNQNSLQTKIYSWEKVFSMLEKSLSENFTDISSRHFADQLLHVTIQILIFLLNIVSIKDLIPKDLPDNFGNPKKMFSKFLSSARQFQKRKAFSETIVEDLSFDSPILESWQDLDEDTILKDAVVKGYVPLAQWYLNSHLSMSTSLENIKSVGMEVAFQCLTENHLQKAITVIFNIGSSPSEIFYKNFQSTTAKELRIVLLPYLQMKNLLSEEDESAIRLLEILEESYQCSRLKKTKQHQIDLLNKTSNFPIASEVLDALETACNFNENIAKFEDLTEESETENMENFSYAQFSIEWLKELSSETKQKMLVIPLLKGELPKDYPKPSAFIIWSYLLENDYLEELLAAISQHFNEQTNSSLQFPFDWAINDEMINFVPNSSSSELTKELVLNSLARHGMICEDELEDISKVLNRLGRIESVFLHPHPFENNFASMSVVDYNHRIIHHCLQHKLWNVLLFFLKDKNHFHDCTFCPVCRGLLLTSMLVFCNWNQEQLDHKRFLSLILSSAQLTYGLSDSSLNTFYKSAPESVVIASLLYSPLILTENDTNNHWNNLEKAISTFPTLQRVFYQGWPNSKPDITLYQLLSANTMFETSRLFGWQKSNTLASEEAVKEIPHFSSPYLVQQYSLQQCIDVLYYLIEGRPNQAYLKFMLCELLNKKVVSKERKSQACSDAYHLALKHYKTPKIVLACIAFIELFGQDSLSLRIDLQVILAIHNEGEEFAQNEENEHAKLLSLITSSQSSTESAQTIAYILDHIIISKSYSRRSPTVYYYMCLLLMAFCRSHGLNMVPSFLSQYANNGDWLMLLVMAEILGIQREQLIELVKHMPVTYLADHLTTALTSPPPIRKQSIRRNSAPRKVQPMVAKESNQVRSLLYNRIGLGKENVKGNSFSPPSDTSDDDLKIEIVANEEGTSSSTDDTSSIDSGCQGSQPMDLFEQLLLASKTQNPGNTLLYASLTNRNPALALIAASLTNTSSLNCLCTWIISTMCLGKAFPLKTEWTTTNVAWNLTNLSELALDIVRLEHFKILNRAMFYFNHESPLYYLTSYLESFFEMKEYNSSYNKLEEFKMKLEDKNRAEHSETDIGEKFWVEAISIEIVKLTIISTSCRFEQLIFLQNLSRLGFQDLFPKSLNPPNFSMLACLIECVGEQEIPLPLKELLLPVTDINFTNAAVTVVKNLQNLKDFSNAKKFGKLAGLPNELVIISQLVSEAETLNENYADRKMFWIRCDELLQNEKTPPENAAEFFKKGFEKCISHLERYMILIYIVKWSKFAQSADLNIWESEMWLCCVKCEAENTQLEVDLLEPLIPNVDSEQLPKWELLDIEDLRTENETLHLENESERQALNRIILSLLDSSHIGEAWKLANLFGYFCLELEAVLTCLQLAKGTLKLDNVNPKIIAYCDTKNSKKSNLSSSVICENEDEAEDSQINKSVLNILEEIHNSISHGKQACYRVITHYHVSKLLWNRYSCIVAENDSSRLLLNILNCNTSNKFNFAKDLLTVRKIPDYIVLNCLYQKITDSLQRHASFVDSRQPGNKVSNEQAVSDVAFQLLLRLCKDPALLGSKLLRDIDMSKDKDHCYHIALCVSSHNCFTSCCNMEGISKVLRKAREITMRLAELEQFELMVSLLTGIGRYGEMTYIFDMLRENAQFELLFKKGMEKLPLLRLALLDYLKKYHTNDREIHSMLAFRFQMFRDIAQMLEKTSIEKLIKLTPSDKGKSNIVSQLEVILQDLEAAAKSYIEADCLKHAQSCARQAEMVALQIHLMATNVWILGIDGPQSSKFIVEHKRFLEANIVASAYQQHHAWDQALLYNVVQRGDWDYLRDFQAHVGLTATLIGSIARRFHLNKTKDERQESNMKRMLNFCTDITARYQIANQLGFSDITLELLKGDAGPYLQDIIEQKKNPEDWLLSSM